MGGAGRENIRGSLELSTGVIFVITLAILPWPTLGAPVVANSTNQFNFYETLFKNGTNQNCTLPIVSKTDKDYVSFKVNQFCYVDSEGNAMLCRSLRKVFVELCPPKSSQGDVKPAAIDVKGSLGLADTCKLLNGKDLDGGQLFPEVDNRCSSICKNSKEDRESFSEYNIVQVHPACILLLEAVQIQRKGVVVNPPVVKNITADKISPNLGVTSPAQEEKKRPEVALAGQVSEKDAVVKPSKRLSSSSDVVPLAVSSKPSNQGVVEPVDINTSSSRPPVSGGISSGPGKSQNVNVVVATQPQSRNVPNNQPAKPVIESEAKSKSSTTTSTTTVASVDIVDVNEPVPVPSDTEMKVSKSSGSGPAASSTKSPPLPGIVKDGHPVAGENAAGIKKKKKKPIALPPSKISDDDNVLADVGSEDYTDDTERDLNKPPLRNGDSDDPKDGDIPVPETENLGYDTDPAFRKPSGKFTGNGFRGDLPDIGFSRGAATTINFSVKESEGTGFFNYFLFSVTLVGVIYLILHNKKRLIAYVVEGRRPRSRTRRVSSSSSAGGQYKRLENNFD